MEKKRRNDREKFYLEHCFYMNKFNLWLVANPQSDISHPYAQELLLHAVGALNTFVYQSEDREAHKLLMYLLEFVEDGPMPANLPS